MRANIDRLVGGAEKRLLLQGSVKVSLQLSGSKPTNHIGKPDLYQELFCQGLDSGTAFEYTIDNGRRRCRKKYRSPAATDQAADKRIAQAKAEESVQWRCKEQEMKAAVQK